jgi:hypothetical protein
VDGNGRCSVYQADNWRNGRNLGGTFVCGIGYDNTPDPSEERFANATLIAAAPDLLEACKQLLEQYAPRAQETVDREGEAALLSSVPFARAAILKATE